MNINFCIVIVLLAWLCLLPLDGFPKLMGIGNRDQTQKCSTLTTQESERPQVRSAVYEPIRSYEADQPHEVSM